MSGVSFSSRAIFRIFLRKALSSGFFCRFCTALSNSDWVAARSGRGLKASSRAASQASERRRIIQAPLGFLGADGAAAGNAVVVESGFGVAAAAAKIGVPFHAPHNLAAFGAGNAAF